MRLSFALLVVALLATPAHAQTRPAPARARVIGAGFGLGFGWQRWTDYSTGLLGDRDQGWLLNLGSFELSAFVDDHFSIDVSAQLALTVLDAAWGGDFAWASTVYFDWSLGEGQHRCLVGPGLGVVGHTNYQYTGPTPYPIPSDAGAELHIAALFGYEYLRDDRLFGFRVMTRPWVSLGGGARGLEPGGGAMLELGFMFYAL